MARAPKESLIANKIAKMLGLPDGRYSIERTHAGFWQRSKGAWSWCLWSIDDIHNGASNYGSQWPAKLIVKGFTQYEFNGQISLDPSPFPGGEGPRPHHDDCTCQVCRAPTRVVARSVEDDD